MATQGGIDRGATSAENALGSESVRISEAEFRRLVLRAAGELGWLFHSDERSAQLHPYVDADGARRWRRHRPNTAPGFPDLLLLSERPLRLYGQQAIAFVELKGDRGPRGGGADVSLTTEQQRWLTALRAVAEMDEADNSTSAASAPLMFVGLWRPRSLERVYLFLAGEGAFPCDD